MGYPQPTLKVVFGGKAYNDIWRTSVDMGLNVATPPNSAQLNGILTSKIQPQILTWWNSFKAQNSPSVDYSFLAAYFYPTGATAATAAGLSSLTGVPGTAAGPFMSLRTALVCTKLTGFAGRHNRGRNYVPYTYAAGVDLNGQTSAAIAATYAGSFSTLLTNLNAQDYSAAGITSAECIVTSSRAPSVGFRVGNIRVDTLLDSQRRRTNKDAATATSTQPVV